MTRSKDLRRIEAAIANQNEAELKWALAECELRRRFARTHSDFWYRIEERVKAALEGVAARR